jgi:spore coat protein U-like protein
MTFKKGLSFCTAALLSAGLMVSVPAAPLLVSTTIAPSCVINSGSLVALTPTYGGPSNISIGSATTLNTTCNTSTPTVAFSDATGAGTVYIMNSGANVLNFQISNGTSCSGIVTDTAIPQATTQVLGLGSGAVYNICAAVIIGQQLVKAGAYTDTVTVTIAAGA